MTNYFGQLLEPFRDAWTFYQGLDPEQQRSVLLIGVVGAVALVFWVTYQAHGDRAVVVLPAGLLRIALLLLVLPLVAVGKAAGRETSVPGVLRRSWTAEPDPDGPQIPTKEVNPMKLPGRLGARPSARAQTYRTTRRRRNR